MIIDQLPLLTGDALTTDELALERGTTTYKATITQITAKVSADIATVAASVSAKQDKVTANGILKGNGSSVSAATKGTDYGALSFTVTLLAANWASNQQTVNNANFAASGYAYVVTPASASFADYAAAVIYADNVTTDGNMTFHCDSAPSADLTVNVVRVVSA